MLGLTGKIVTHHTWTGVAVVGESIATAAGAVVAVVRVDAHLRAFTVVELAFVDGRVRI